MKQTESLYTLTRLFTKKIKSCILLPVPFDIYMCILLNEFTIYFIDYKVRLHGLEKISKSAKDQGRLIYKHFYKGFRSWKKNLQ